MNTETIVDRDGKPLDVELTLHMAQQHITYHRPTVENRVKRDYHVEVGLAMALEAALLELKKGASP